MTEETSSDFIARAVTEVKRLKPEYGLMLELYEKIFIAQEESVRDLRIPECHIPEEILEVKLREQFPLLEIAQFTVDAASAGRLLVSLCEIVSTAGDAISETAKQLKDAVEKGAVSSDDCFSAFLNEDESFFKAIEDEVHIDRRTLIFLVFNSIKPSLKKCAALAAEHLDPDKEWDKGFCPVCGSMPELSVFEDNGKRSLACGFCGHRWRSKRVFCSFCGNTDHETLRYFEIEDEEEYRVDVCDKCKRYIKTVDVNKLSRPVYLPLECITTPYIDLKFREMGFSPAHEVRDQ